jgi:predicted DNA-binding transcriptional regulator AlpA
MDGLMNERAVAVRLGVTVAALRKWRLLGRGPAYYKVGGRSVRYAAEDIEQFLATQRVGQQEDR